MRIVGALDVHRKQIASRRWTARRARCGASGSAGDAR